MAEHVPRTIESMQQLAISRGGWCLSDTYRKPLSWRCAHGHEWLATAPDTIKGRWCSVCARFQRRNLRLEEAQRLASEREGHCLSTHFESLHAPMEWQCAQRHRWQASLGNIKSNGTWCPTCGHLNQRSTLEAMQQLASQRGGRCLSKVYVDRKSALIWECAKGHRWEVAPRIILRGHWCAICAQDPHRYTLEQMQAVARARGGECLSSSYVNILTQLTWRCEQGHTWNSAPTNIISGCWCPQCDRDSKRSNIEAMQALAQLRGGGCLSPAYNGLRGRLTMRCALGHIWDATAANIRLGHWCRQCVSGHRRGTIEAMQAMAQDRGGRCLSERYVNSQSKLKWLCSMGHSWLAAPAYVTQGTWCPQCARLNSCRKNSSRRKYLPAR
ncbi:hypothetical protein C7534_104409 [Pseudomonas sp. OV226]|nr:hypothetical protein C7534_104409 [Pseudomonas sp. OV226]